MKTECPECAKAGDGAMCGAKHCGYYCTRPNRHEGGHVACSHWFHALMCWRDEFTGPPSCGADAKGDAAA